MSLPRMIKVRQIFDRTALDDVKLSLKSELANTSLRSMVKASENVAIAVGSRGIANIDIIAKTTADALKKLGAKPFIMPAMGSHGGAKAEGQKSVLEHYGISEETMGVPIKATMEVVKIGEIDDGVPVLIGRDAYEADKVVVVNRIKPHTDFSGEIESGLMKLMAIGLGKQKGANMYHRTAFRYGFEHTIKAVGRVVINSGKIAFGVGIVENAYDETAVVSVIPANRIEDTEKKLLIKAKSLMGKLPFDELDLLIIDLMGKDISGTGMDPNIIGRMMQDFEPEPEKPDILRIFVRDLTDKSYGNFVGLGFADFTTTRLVNKLNRQVTYINSITGLGPQKSRIPMYFDTDREAIENALETIGLTKSEDCKVVRIKSTLHLEDVECSEVLLEELEERSDLEIVGELKEMEFDRDHNLKT